MFDFTTESRCLQSKALNLGKILSWILAMLLGLIYGNTAQMSRFNSDLVDRAQIDDYINLQTTAAEREYGDDYVEYDEEIRVGTKSADISADLDMMLLEMDMESDDLFGEDGDEDEDDSDDFGDEDSSEEEKLDIYEFDDVDPEIFRDPTLMVKWLNKQ